MRLLIVSDSHGRELIKAFATDYPTCTVRIMLVGSTTDVVRENYARRQQEAISFMPDNIILHVGHNDVVYHPFHNTSPRHIKEFFPDVVSFLRLLRERHAESKIFYSTMLPRGVGRMFSETKRIQYNTLAARFGVLAQSTCRREGFGFLLNSCMWQSVRQKIGKTDIFEVGGLHLHEGGKKMLVKGWMDTMFPATSMMPQLSVATGGSSFN